MLTFPAPSHPKVGSDGRTEQSRLSYRTNCLSDVHSSLYMTRILLTSADRLGRILLRRHLVTQRGLFFG